MAALAAWEAPTVLTIIAACAPVIAPRVQPPATPEDTAAPSATGSSLNTTHGEIDATAKQKNPVSNVPTPATLPSCDVTVGDADNSCMPIARLITIAGLASTNATASCTIRRTPPRIIGNTDDDHTNGANAATKYSNVERMNSKIVVTIIPIIPSSTASGPRNVAPHPAPPSTPSTSESSTSRVVGRACTHTVSESKSAKRINVSNTTSVNAVPNDTTHAGEHRVADQLRAPSQAPPWMAPIKIIATVTNSAIGANAATTPLTNQPSVRPWAWSPCPTGPTRTRSATADPRRTR